MNLTLPILLSNIYNYIHGIQCYHQLCIRFWYILCQLLKIYILLPIDDMLKETVEDRNKHFRKYKQNFFKKFFRKCCNWDVLNRLLLISGSFINSLRKLLPSPKKNKIQILKRNSNSKYAASSVLCSVYHWYLENEYEIIDIFWRINVVIIFNFKTIIRYLDS